MARTTTITKQDVINDVHRVASKTETGNVRVTDYTKKGAFSIGTITRMFGSAKNDVFAQILNMDTTDDVLDQSTLIMLTRKFAKQMEENGLEIDIETFKKEANFDVNMLAKTYESIEEGLVAADVLMYVEYDPEDEDAETIDDYDSDVEPDSDEHNVDNNFDDDNYDEEDSYEEYLVDYEDDENIENEDLDDDNYDAEDSTNEDSDEEDLVDYEDDDNTNIDDLDEDAGTQDEDDDVDDINLDDFDLSDFDLDIEDIGDDDAFFDAMTDSYEDDFYKEEDLKAAKMEMQQLFGVSQWQTKISLR